VHAGERLAAARPALGLPAAPAARHEYSSLGVTLETVEALQQAIDHIHAYGSGHTESIITEDAAAADAFLLGVDSACVFHNASTRFSDGFRCGAGGSRRGVDQSIVRVHALRLRGISCLLDGRVQRTDTSAAG
jgi:gamma-glutamyl phosphate reductase